MVSGPDRTAWSDAQNPGVQALASGRRRLSGRVADQLGQNGLLDALEVADPFPVSDGVIVGVGFEAGGVNVKINHFRAEGLFGQRALIQSFRRLAEAAR